MEKIYKGEIQRFLPIFQAMADGKTIQCKNGNDWIDIDNDEDGLNIDSLIGYQDCFRIKPEKCRLFKDAEECWQEMLKHKPFGWVIKESNGRAYNIQSVLLKENVLYIRGSYKDLEVAFNEYTFADGAPFGVKVEE